MSTDLGRSAAEILELVEHRWNIETVHEESNAKFGLKQYQLERKQAIERYIQLVFLAWTLVTFAERANVAFWEDRGGLSVRLDHAKEAYLVETLLALTEEIDPSLRLRERREELHELVRDFSWSSIANLLITSVGIVGPLDDDAVTVETLFPWPRWSKRTGGINLNRVRNRRIKRSCQVENHL